MLESLAVLNPIPRHLDGPELLHDLVAHHQSTTNVAIDFTGADGTQQLISYERLHSSSDRLARQLLARRNAGTRHSKHFIVPLYMKQCPSLYISQLAILKAGGAFCPIPLDVPEERLRFILHDVDASLLLTTTDMYKQLPELDDIDVLDIESIQRLEDSNDLTVSILPSHPAYIMYTSGSTGTPKGVILSHTAVTQALLAHDRHIPCFSRFLQFANPTFDVSVFEIFFPLYRGVTLVVCDRTQLLSDLPGVMNSLNVDAAELTPSVANSLLHDRRAVPGLRLLLTIGEMLKKSVVEEFGRDELEDGILHGMYGPTEATIHCTLQTVFEKTMPVGNIGAPLDTVSAFIVRPADPSDKGGVPEILKVGEEGELAVGGYQLADGYLNRQEQTDAAFVHHPQYGTLYRTGDRAKLTAEGRLECLGRISGGQVKLRGQRMELGEIEYAAARTTGCRTAVADVINNALVAFCVRADSTLSQGAIRQTCREWLPAFMVPTEIVIMDDLPYLASGKVDRKALSKKHLNTRCAMEGRERPQTAKSNTLCEIVSKALNMTIDESTDLSGAGVDSLSAIRIGAELRRAGFPQLNANDILEARSVEDLDIFLVNAAANVSVKPESKPQSFRPSNDLREAVLRHPLVQDKTCEVEDVYLCTPVQSAMLSETARNPRAYCNSVGLEVSHGKGIADVRSALIKLSQKHALLRSGFLTLDEGRSSPAVIQWKDLDPSQIVSISHSPTDFVIQTEEAALRPCRFQLQRVEATTHILLCIHHALYDQWSIDVLKADLSQLLKGCAVEARAPFQSVSEFYASQLTAERPEDSQFWQEHLQGFTVTPVPNLTGRVLESHQQRTPFCQVDFDMGAASLKTKQMGVSLPSFFQAAFAYLLASLSGSSDVTFGTVFSGRHLPIEGVEHIFGPCLTTLPCRIDLSGVRTCRDFVRLVHDSNRAMQRHATTPLTQIKAHSGSLPDVPLFDALFVWQDTSLQSSDNCVVRETDSVDHHEFNLVFELQPRERHIAVRATYRDHLLPLPQVDLLMRQMACFANHLLRQSEALLDTLGQGLTPDLLSISNGEPTVYSSPQGITALIEQQAERQPTSPAVVFAHEVSSNEAKIDTLSYADLNSRANQVARFLRLNAVLPDELVCICMEKSLDLYVAILGVLKAGAGYLPLTPETPSARIDNIVRQANVKVCLGDEKTLPLLSNLPCVKTIVNAYSSAFEHFNPSDLKLPYVGDHVAYTVFTSGSTGEPKGVAVTNDNLNGNLMALAELYGAKPGDRLLQACSQAFDVSVFEIFFALTQGLCLCSGTKATLFGDLEASIRALAITHLSLTPTVAALVNPVNVPSVKFLVTAGEAMTDTVRKMWAGRGLHQGYGPSETTNICSVNMNMSPQDHLSKVGPPLLNTSAYVISPDPGVRLLPRGAVGELAFGGEQVFRGYLGRHDLNEQKVVHDADLGRIYRSGDVGRIAHDGGLLITGRLGDQVKIRGNRVELGEISSVALSDPAVADCTAVVQGEEATEQQLMLFWVPRNADSREHAACEVLRDFEEATGGLIELLGSKLPGYMVPGAVIPLSHLPLTSQGKLDRRFLRHLVDSMNDELRRTMCRTNDAHADTELWTEEEREVAQVLAQLLGIAQTSIGKTTSFFALGLNSLSAIAFARQLERRRRQRVSIDIVMRSSSVARLAAAMSLETRPETKQTENDVSAVFSQKFKAQLVSEYGSRGLTVEEVLPCTPLQEVMLAANASEGGSAYYNSTTYRLRGNASLIRNVWVMLVKRHSILRTHFVQTEKTKHPFAQVVLKDATLPWQAADMDADGHPERQDTGQPALDMSRPFQLVLRETPTGPFLTLHMHHAVYDGVSMTVLLREAEALYKGEPLPPAIEYKSFLSVVTAQNSNDAVQYWAHRVHDFTPRPFPAKADGGASVLQMPKTSLSVSRDQVSEFCRRQSVTPLSVFHATWAKLLTLCQGTTDICFGNVVSGRTVSVPDVERLVAPCFNTIPVRIDTSRCRTNIQLVKQLHGQNLSDLNFQLTGLRQIQTYSKMPHLHLFDSLVLLQPAQKGCDESIWELVDERGAMDMPLILEILTEGANYSMHLHFQPRFVPGELAESLASAFDAALSACLTFPSGDVGYLGQVSADGIKGSLRPAVIDDLANGDVASTQGSDGVGEGWSPVELQVRDAFATLSGAEADRILKDTTMYQVGLDSLNAAQVAVRLRAQGLEMSVADVISNLTPRGISAAISRKQKPAEVAQAVPDFAAFDRQHRQRIAEQLHTEAARIESLRPCTKAQLGMLAQSISSNGSLYINHVSYEVPPGAEVAAIVHAWKQVQRRHPSLRTGFHQVDDPLRPYVMVCYAEAPTPAMQPTSGLSGDDPRMLETCEKEATVDIMRDLAQPPWRICIQQHPASNTMTLSIHHALYDAEGLQYLLADFATALDGEQLGAALSLDPLLMHCLIDSSQQQEARTFWEDTLRDISTARFPDLQPDVLQCGTIISRARTLSVSQSAIQDCARSHNATVQAVGQSIWAMLLAAYLGESNVTFGTVLSARPASKNQETAFPSVLTIPVLCNTDKAAGAIINDMVSYNASTYRYRHTPLADLQRYAGDASRALFDTVFVYQKTTQNNADSFDWPVIRETAAVDYAASLELEAGSGDTMAIRLTASDHIIPAEQADLMLEQYEHLLANVVRGDAVSSHGISSVIPAKEGLLPSKAKYLHDFVMHGALKHPNAPALEFVYRLSDSHIEYKTWTYQQLDQRSNQVANLLRMHNVRSGSIVALCMAKCPEATFAFVGILKAGCAFLALDPDLPEARRHFILEDSSAAALLVDAQIGRDVAAGHQSETPTLTITEDSLSGMPDTAVESGLVDASATSYCLYTSGTTGTPKGCEITHENAVQAMLAFQRLFAEHWTASSRWLQFASYWFDVSVLEQFWSWSVGITVVGAPRDLVLNDLSGFIQQLRITHIDLTPSLARLVHPDDVPSLHGGVFITGGEALKQEIIDAWGAVRTVCNGYGPTEATIGVTMNTFVGPNAKPSNIGKQFDNVGSFVLAPDSDQPVLRGAVGELCVSGPLVGKGYLNRPELTTKSFPYLQRHGARVYRTGDLVRLLADGSFCFIGRKDTQAKLRGQRLEIGEIDSTIKGASEKIAEVVSLVVKSDDDSRQTLVSFFTAEWPTRTKDLVVQSSAEATQLVSAASEACRRKLPGYMVPTHIIPVSHMPLTVNNKIDSKKLSWLFTSLSNAELQSANGDGGCSVVLNDSERKICSVLAKLLHIDADALTRGTNMFSAGLSSVSAITLASLLKRQGLRQASVAMIMQSSTVGSLAAALSTDDTRDGTIQRLARQAELSITAYAQRHRRTLCQRLSMESADIAAIAPCTPLQAGLLIESMRSERRPYFNEFRYSLHDIAWDRLQKAFVRLAHNIETLRTIFVQTDDGFAQVVLQSPKVSWHDCEPSSDDVDRTVAWYKAEWIAANDADVLDPIQVVAVRTTGHHLLVFHVHHALYDGISWDLLLDRLAEAYQENSTPDCGPSFVQMLPHGPLRSEHGAKSFWQNHLGGLSPRPIARRQDIVGEDTLTANIHLQDVNGLDKTRMALGVSHQAVLQACFEVALQQHFSNTSTYGHVVSGRTIAFDGADRVIGPLFNTLPAAILLQGEDNWSRHISRSHQSNVSVLPYQHTPLGDIRKWLNRPPSDPLFEALFVFQNQSEDRTSRSSELWEPVEQPPTADYPLALEVTLEADGTLRIAAVAQSSVADEPVLEALLRSIEKAVRVACDSPDRRVSEDFVITATGKGSEQHQDERQDRQLNGVHHFEWTQDAVALRQAIAQVAGLPSSEIDEHTAMFALGLDSIDAVKLASRLKKAGIMLPVSKILMAQTIPRMLDAAQTEHVANEQTTETHQLDDIERTLTTLVKQELPQSNEVERALPATPHQEALIADMLRSEYKEYYNHDILRVQPDVNLGKLKAAWQTVIDQSPILRTGFRQVAALDVDATFAQIVWKPGSIEVAEVAIDSQNEMDSLLKRITDKAMASKDGECSTHITLVNWKGERYLVLSLAHAQYDGHSLALLHGDVQRAYHDTLEARPSYDKLIGEALDATNEEARRFWESSLSGASSAVFPSRKCDSHTETVHRAERVSQLSAENLRSFCQTHGVSVQALAQTCWSLLLAHYTHSFEVIFGVVLACRDSEEAEQVMFPTMNTVPVRTMLHGTRRELLQYMQGMINDMRPYQRTPLRTIQSVCADVVNAREAQGSSGLFDTLFIYQHRPESELTDEKKLYESVGGSSSVEYPVAVEMEVIGAEVHMRTACKDSVLDQQGTRVLLRELDQVLRRIVEAPEEPSVDFVDEGATICGLPAFQLDSKKPDDKADRQDESMAEEENRDLGPTALAIRDILAQVAKVPAEQIAPNATIETIGIDSISAIKVAALLRKREISLSVSDILKAKTVTNMAAMASAKSEASKPQTPPHDTVATVLKARGLDKLLGDTAIAPENVEAILPATAGQVYMLSVWQTSGGQLFYPTFSYEVEGEIDVDQMRLAWKRLIARHAILRTTFFSTNNAEIPMLQVALKDVPESFFDDNDKPDRTNAEQPMVALSLHRSESGWKLDLKIHHALYDAVSLPLLIQDFQLLLSGREPTVPAIRQEDFIALAVTLEAASARKDFWTPYLDSAVPLTLAQPKTKGPQKRVELFKPGLITQTSALEDQARKESLTLQALLFAAYAKIYASLATASTAESAQQGAKDVVLGIYLSNRSHLPDLDRLAAPTLNLIPLLVRSPNEKGVLEVAKEVQRDLHDIGTTAERSSVALWEIAEWTGVKVDTFVNFIKLPEVDEEARDVEGGQGGVMVKELDEYKRMEYARVSEPDERVGCEMPKEMQGLKVADAYQYSLDLEATVANGGLDVGLFCPEEMLGLEEAEKVLEELRGVLEKVVGKAKE